MTYYSNRYRNRYRRGGGTFRTPSTPHHPTKKDAAMTTTFPAPKFSLGDQILATPAAIEAIRRAGQDPLYFLGRHEVGDWGELCPDDKSINDDAVRTGGRIMSAYRTLKGERLWVITEAADENGNRSATTILLPEEY